MEILRYHHGLHYALNHEDNLRIRLEYAQLLGVLRNAQKMQLQNVRMRMKKALIVLDRTIVSFLRAEDLSRFSGVCKRWIHFGHDDRMWSTLCIAQFGVDPQMLKNRNNNDNKQILSHDIYKMLHRRILNLLRDVHEEDLVPLVNSIHL